jgi:hypothetical protein
MAFRLYIAKIGKKGGISPVRAIRRKGRVYLPGAMPNGPFIHRCQLSNGKSCGACSGIYNYINYIDSSREALLVRLRRRTERIRSEVRGPRPVAAFSDFR